MCVCIRVYSYHLIPLSDLALTLKSQLCRRIGWLVLALSLVLAMSVAAVAGELLVYVANSDWIFNFFECLLMSSTEVRGISPAFVIYIPRAADPLNLKNRLWKWVVGSG